MKKILIISAVLIACLEAFSQVPTVPSPTNAPPEVITGPGRTAWDFLTQGSNWIVAPFGEYSFTHNEWGGGVAAGYRLNDFIVPFMRIDFMPTQVIVPSATAQLQLPVKILDTLTLTPFGYSGIATAISGRGAQNGELIGIFGTGLAVRLGRHWDILAAYELRTGVNDELVLFGFGWKPKGW